jgi:hypothetical protein
LSSIGLLEIVGRLFDVAQSSSTAQFLTLISTDFITTQ